MMSGIPRDPHLLLLLGLGVHCRDQLDALAFLNDAVHVQHALVAGREYRLVLQKLQDLQSCCDSCQFGTFSLAKNPCCNGFLFDMSRQPQVSHDRLGIRS